jgi:mRNA interferase RelE/StbE
MAPAYTVVWTRKAARMLERLPREVQVRIVDSVEGITGEPFAFVRKVEGTPYHRLRVGHYRIVIQITASHMTIYVVRVAPRETVYRNL